MRVILAACNAKYIHSNLAVYNLRACLRQVGAEVILREYTINQRKDEILRDLYECRADLLCVSCYIWNISFLKEILEDYGKICPTVPVWAGGPEVTYDSLAFLKENPWIAGVMRGEGEQTISELVQCYMDHTVSKGEILGITWRDSRGELHENPDRPVMDLSQVPFAYEELTDFEHRIIYYESSRGCPFSCSYCLSSVDKKLRFRSLELVCKELQFFLDRKVPQVKFVDRTFNCRHEHAMAIWKYILEHDNGITNFHFEIAADLMREEELELISKMRPGLIQLEIGVQSTNPETILEIRRVMDFKKVTKVVRKVQKMENTHQHLDLIAGLPKEDFQSFRHSFHEVYELRPEQLQLGFLKVLKGSYMAAKTEDYGCVYQAKEPYEVLGTKWLSYGEILRLKRVESMVEVYYNSGQFTKTLPVMERYFSHPFDFYDQLGEFYEKRGYASVSHSRLRRYEILLEFLLTVPEGDQKALKEAMIVDLYLRENLKSRPVWADDQRKYEREIWAYRKAYKVPKTAHVEVFPDGRALLFDYQQRNPLTRNAMVTEVELWQQNEPKKF